MELNVYFVGKTLVKPAQQSSSAGDVYTVLHDVGVDFGRCVLECVKHGSFDFCNALLKAVRYFLVAYRHLHWQGRYSVRAVHNVVFRALVSEVGKRASHVYLYSFGHSFTHFHVVLVGHVFLYVGIEIVAGHFD